MVFNHWSVLWTPSRLWRRRLHVIWHRQSSAPAPSWSSDLSTLLSHNHSLPLPHTHSVSIASCLSQNPSSPSFVRSQGHTFIVYVHEGCGQPPCSEQVDGVNTPPWNNCSEINCVVFGLPDPGRQAGTHRFNASLETLCAWQWLLTPTKHLFSTNRMPACVHLEVILPAPANRWTLTYEAARKTKG